MSDYEEWERDEGASIADVIHEAVENEFNKREPKEAHGIRGWICPRCGKGMSPYTNSCNCIRVGTHP